MAEQWGETAPVEEAPNDAAPVAAAAPGSDRASARGPARLPTYVPRLRLLAYLGLVAVSWLIPKTDGKVLLHSTGDLDDGVLAVADELAVRGYRPTVLLEDPTREPTLRRLTSGLVDVVPLHSLRAKVHFLTARYVMSTESVFGGFPSPPSQVSVNLWHGEPPTKATGRFGSGRGLRATHSPVCSTVGRAYRSAEFGVHPRRVPIVGALRNDRMLQAVQSRADARRVLLGDGPGLAYLWLPSFRVGRWGTSTRVDATGARPSLPYTPAELRHLDDWLVERGVRVLVKLHPRDVGSLSTGFRALRALTDGDLAGHGLTLHTALPAFDGLITDMSSVWVDYLLLNKPIIFAFPDIVNYRNGRGLNLEPYEDWVPGPFAQTMDQLIGALRDVAEGRDPAADERARSRLRFHQHLDDRSTARLLDHIGLRDAAETG